MVLVDTSVWLRSFANRSPYAAELDRLLSRNEVTGHELIYGELLIGDRGGQRKFLEDYALLGQARLIAHRDVVGFVRDRDLHGRGLGWIDVHVLASALVERLRVWTADRSLHAVAKELGVAYELPVLKPFIVH